MNGRILSAFAELAGYQFRRMRRITHSYALTGFDRNTKRSVFAQAAQPIAIVIALASLINPLFDAQAAMYRWDFSATLISDTGTAFSIGETLSGHALVDYDQTSDRTLTNGNGMEYPSAIQSYSFASSTSGHTISTDRANGDNPMAIIVDEALATVGWPYEEVWISSSDAQNSFDSTLSTSVFSIMASTTNSNALPNWPDLPTVIDFAGDFASQPGRNGSWIYDIGGTNYTAKFQVIDFEISPLTTTSVSTPGSVILMLLGWPYLRRFRALLIR